LKRSKQNVRQFVIKHKCISALHHPHMFCQISGLFYVFIKQCIQL